MKRTKKYAGAIDILTHPHETQDELYSELNRLGWYWDSKQQRWVRDDRVAEAETKFIRIRVLSGASQVQNVADNVVEAMQERGLRLLEKSPPYPCRPPQQNDSRVYLTFEDMGAEND